MLARYGLGNLVGNLYDTGLAAALLIYGGVLERHPALRVVLYHAGGALPSLLGRLDMGYRNNPECRAAVPRPPSTYVDQFAFDTIAFRQDMLRYLVTPTALNAWWLAAITHCQPDSLTPWLR